MKCTLRPKLLDRESTSPIFKMDFFLKKIDVLGMFAARQKQIYFFMPLYITIPFLTDSLSVGQKQKGKMF